MLPSRDMHGLLCCESGGLELSSRSWTSSELINGITYRHVRYECFELVIAECHDVPDKSATLCDCCREDRLYDVLRAPRGTVRCNAGVELAADVREHARLK